MKVYTRVILWIYGNYIVWLSHATDGPPKIGPPGPSAVKYVAVDGPPGPSMAAIDGPPDHLCLWRRKWSLIATDGPP